jgi:excinuclease ABC subunit B
LRFEEFEERMGQTVFVSATPGGYEAEHAEGVAEQLIRPTGLLDPAITVRPVEGQIDDLLGEVRTVTERGERTLVTTLTTKMAEDLTDYLGSVGVKVKYLHHKVDTMERMEIIRDLRLGKFDVLVGINLLREGLDIPEVSLVLILDADKEGFLRSETSLIQTVGRAARNANGRVVMYADTVTGSMERAIRETNRRRAAQISYNEENGIIPRTIAKEIRDPIALGKPEGATEETAQKTRKKLSPKERERTVERLRAEMRDAARRLEFERAAYLRDRIRELEETK